MWALQPAKPEFGPTGAAVCSETAESREWRSSTGPDGLGPLYLGPCSPDCPPVDNGALGGAHLEPVCWGRGTWLRLVGGPIESGECCCPAEAAGVLDAPGSPSALRSAPSGLGPMKTWPPSAESRGWTRRPAGSLWSPLGILGALGGLPWVAAAEELVPWTSSLPWNAGASRL